MMGRPSGGGKLNEQAIRKLRGRKKPVPMSKIATDNGVSRQAVYQFCKRKRIK